MSGRRWLLLVLAPLVGAAIAIAASLIAGAISSADAAATRTTAVGVGLREYRIALYRNRVLPGRVKFNIENLGEDAHDLRVVGPGGASSAVRGTSAEVKAGQRVAFVVTLRRRGLYRVICTLGDHEAQGMVSRLRVVRRL
jgi:plastocyanin